MPCALYHTSKASLKFKIKSEVVGNSSVRQVFYKKMIGDVNTVLSAQNVTFAKSEQNKSERALCTYQGKTPTQKC